MEIRLEIFSVIQVKSFTGKVEWKHYPDPERLIFYIGVINSSASAQMEQPCPGCLIRVVLGLGRSTG